MARVRARVRDLTSRARSREDLRRVIADVNLVLRGWAQYFRTGNAATKFHHIDRYVEDRLHALRRARAGSRGHLRYGADSRRSFSEALGLVRLRGTIQYPGVRMPRPEDHLVSRVREIRMHGLNGGLANSQSLTGHK
jgi:RNA-directed DNA polymerase